MSYRSILPQAFPYVLEIPWAQVQDMIELFEPREEFPTGSSYAITTDARPGFVNLWMSDSSFVTFEEMNGKHEAAAREQMEMETKREAEIQAQWGPMLP